MKSHAVAHTMNTSTIIRNVDEQVMDTTILIDADQTMEVDQDLAVGHLYNSIYALDPADEIDAEIISRVANVLPRKLDKGQRDFALGAQEVRQDMNILKRIKHSNHNQSNRLHQSHQAFGSVMSADNNGRHHSQQNFLSGSLSRYPADV